MYNRLNWNTCTPSHVYSMYVFQRVLFSHTSHISHQNNRWTWLNNKFPHCIVIFLEVLFFSKSVSVTNWLTITIRENIEQVDKLLFYITLQQLDSVTFVISLFTWLLHKKGFMIIFFLPNETLLHFHCFTSSYLTLHTLIT